MQRIADAIRNHCAGARRVLRQPSAPLLDIAGRTVALSMRTLTVDIPQSGLKQAPRLRNDTVVRRVRRELERALAATIPDRQVVVVTITAPIRRPARTVRVIEDRIRSVLVRRPREADIAADILGNQVRIRLLSTIALRTAKLVLCVHQGASDAQLLLNLTHSLIRTVGAATSSCGGPTMMAQAWLVLTTPVAALPVALCRDILAQLGLRPKFSRIYLCRDGTVDLLT